MAWERVIIYFALNFTGFIIFNEIWKRIKRPPPIDYTTIPGLKAPGLEETEAAISFAPGELIIEKSLTRGCLDQFQHLSVKDFSKSENDPILVKVLNYLNGNYGNISSLFIGPRYVICLSGLKQTKQLRKYWGSNANICPLAFGSIILGDPYFWDSKSIEEWETEIENNETLIRFTSFKNQSKLLLDFPKTGNETFELFENEHKYEIEDFDEKDIPTVISPILVLSFQHEIDIDGHLIPAFIPILLNVGILTNNVSKHKYLNCLSKMYEFVIDQCIFCDGKFLKG